MRRTCLLVLLLLTARPASAQHIDVGDTRIDMHNTGDFVPRMAALGGSVLRVLPGQTVVLAPDATFDAIEVQDGGVLKNDPTRDGIVRASNIQVLPGGTMVLGSNCGHTYRVIIRGTPLDTAVDPYQWSRSILNFGRVEMTGCVRSKSFSTTAGDLHAGDTSIVFPDPVGSWVMVGDELLIPDMAAQAPYITNETKNVVPRERPVTVTAINGSTVTLSKPLDFDHLTIPNLATGGVLVRPYVATLTRNLTIESEAPDTAPGHVAHLMGATRDIRYTEYKYLGRTLNLPVDNTSADLTHIGANQIGKYADHCHHCQGLGSVLQGDVALGRYGQGKWGFVIHGSSDHRLSQNVVVDFDGAGIVTEKGNEVRNQFVGNFGAYMGSGVSDVRQGTTDSPGGNHSHGCDACDGAFIWLDGIEGSTVDHNVGINNRFAYVIFPDVLDEWAPSVPGGPKDTLVPHPGVFSSFSGNQGIANLTADVDSWMTRGANLADPDLARRATTVRNHISVNNWPHQTYLGSIPIDMGGMVFIDSHIQCGRTGGIGLQFNRDYTFVLATLRTNVVGCDQGLGGGSAILFSQFSSGTWANAIDFFFPTPIKPRETTKFVADNITFKPTPFPERQAPLPPAANGLHILTWGEQSPWLPTAETPQGSCLQFVQWPDGKTYCLFGEGGGPTPPPPPPPIITQCNDGVDNDHDGKTDLADPGCDDASDNSEIDPIPPPPPPPTSTLTATSKKSSTGVLSATLKWTGRQGKQVDVMRNGIRVVTTANDGNYVNNIGVFPVGTMFEFRVCEHDVPSNCFATSAAAVTY